MTPSAATPDVAPVAAPGRDPWPDERAVAFAARSWGALAAGGGALATVAVAAPHLGTHPFVAGVLLLLAAAAGAGSVAALRGPGRTVRPAAGAATATGAAVLVTAPGWGLVGTAPVTAAALALGGAVLLGVAARSPRARTEPSPGPWTRLGLLALGALLVSAATVHGLAATEAGAHAVPHGGHGQPLGPATHGHHG